jgi:hypothetical protein
VAIKREARIRRMPIQHPGQRRFGQSERAVARRAGLVSGGETRSAEQAVALGQRHVERIGEQHHHGPARPRPPALQEGDVAGRHFRPQGELELADPPHAAPMAEQVRKAGSGKRQVHVSASSPAATVCRLPPR